LIGKSCDLSISRVLFLEVGDLGVFRVLFLRVAGFLMLGDFCGVLVVLV
jgi:hypothetical protein